MLLIFSVLGVLIYTELQNAMLRQAMEEARAKLAIAKHWSGEVTSASQLPKFLHQLEDLRTAHPELAVALTDSLGSLLEGDRAIVEARLEHEMGPVRDALGRRLFAMQSVIEGVPSLAGARLTIAVDLAPADLVLREFRRNLLLFGVLGLGFIMLSTAWVVKYGLAPIERLSAQASALSPHSLSARLVVDDTVPELREMAKSFNRLLGSIELAHEQLEAFNADVAHELRTPLTNLMSATQLALSAGTTHIDLRDTLASNMEELDRLKQLIHDMLFLAHAEQGAKLPDAAEVDMAREAESVARYFEAALDAHGVVLAIHGQASFVGNASLVRRALANLVANALRYSSAGGEVEIRLIPQGNGATISVRNHGPDICAADLPRVFDRFFRGDTATKAAADGQGLGLAIVRAISRMHGGQTFARSYGGITEIGFTVSGP